MRITSLPTGSLGANTYLVVDEKAKKGFIVDPGGYEPILTAMLKNEEIDLEYIVLTHGHGDHIGGVPALQKEFPKVKVIAAKEEAEMLKDAEINMSALIDADPVAFDADIYVEDEQTISCGEMKMKFLMTPGHSKGGMCIYVGNVVFSGDTLFRESIGRTDFPEASFDVLKKSIQDKLFKLPGETQVLPGHMGATTIEYEIYQNPFVRLKEEDRGLKEDRELS